MATLRNALHPVLRRARPTTTTTSSSSTLLPRLQLQLQPQPQNPRHSRLLNTVSAPTLYTAHARVVGARTGRVEGDDLRVELTMAKALGGAGDRGKTNPEELFAAGYGACFQSAMNASAAQLGIRMPASTPEDSIVDAAVHLVGDMKALDMGLRVDLRVRVKGLSREEVEKVVKRAEEVCPYSRATRGNVETNIEIVDEL